MRLCVLFLACSLSLTYAADTYAQKTKISIDASNQTVETVLKQIKAKTGFDFFFNNKHVDLNRRVSVSANQGNVFEVLKKVFAGTNVTYSVLDKKIILSTEGQNAVQQTQVKVTGRVLDASGEPIIGATVLEKGTTNGIVTDMDGNFTLSVSSDKAEIEISYIGYKTQTLRPQAGKLLTIKLNEDTEVLDEVVVVGYGTMKKKDLTGAVASVKMDDAPVGTVSTISHALAGKAAGLQVNMVSAQPGSGSNFRIRGAASVKAGNDPLVIIDGFPVSPTDPEKMKTGKYDAGSSDNILASINPNDIESIEVLKDASSTAIYGARAGNGVIIITTKKGKTGAPKVTYSGTATVQTLAGDYDMLSAKDFMLQSNRYAKEEWMRSNGTWNKCRQAFEAIYRKECPPNTILHIDSEEEVYNNYLHSEDMLTHLLSFASLVCMLTAMFGIYSLVTLTCEQRRKEIAIRKVNGATVWNILFLFFREYLGMLCLAAILAFPITYVIIKYWIENYVRQVNISPLSFILVFIGMALVVIAGISWRVWKAANENPAEVIKNE